MANPGGKYVLDLSRPFQRTMLRLLCKICEKYNSSADEVLSDVCYSLPGWTCPRKNDGRLFEVPRQGSVTFNFNIEASIETSISGIEDDDFEGFYDMYSMATKMQPSFKKIVPLFACWKELDGDQVSQTAFLTAVSKDFCWKPSHLEHMCRSSPLVSSEVVQSLLPNVLGGETSESLCLMMFPTIQEFLRVHRSMRAFVDFNIMNPTGHYKLDLANFTENAVAEKLVLLDRWEVVLSRRIGRRDVSQHGNMSQIRNWKHRDRRLHLQYASIADFVLPEHDEFELDYSTSRRCQNGIAILDKETFGELLMSIDDSECAPKSKIEVLRLVSHLIVMTCLQMRELLGSFKDEEHRMDCFVIFFSTSIKDVWNAKVFRVKFTADTTAKRLRERLGYITAFPFMQPENARFSLDLSYYDQRMCMIMLLQLAAKEAVQNLRNPSYVSTEGKVDPFPLGVPKSWEDFSKCPKSGTFKAAYSCAPEDRSFKVRQQMGSQYGYFNMEVEEAQVLWWTALTEVPEDILRLLEWCVNKFKSMNEAFQAIDGVDGNGVITLREFEEGLRELECQKFHGKDEQQRISAVFRHLDPGGEGSVSRDEWNVLEQLRREFALCITEFVTFLRRAFGSDLHEPWGLITETAASMRGVPANEVEEISLEEWVQATESVGYHGPARCVFGLMDASEDGHICIDEFMVLDAY